MCVHIIYNINDLEFDSFNLILNVIDTLVHNSSILSFLDLPRRVSDLVDCLCTQISQCVKVMPNCNIVIY